MEKITWGIVGAGRIAAAFAKALDASQDSICYAVASRDKNRGAKFASDWGFPVVYETYEDLFADPKVDAVYIATPHMNHAELSIAAMKAGKSVLCEKTAAVNAHELQDVYDCVEKTGCFFMEALWTKFNPVFRHVMDWISAGKIGRLRAVYADFCISRTPAAVYPDSGYPMNRLFDKSLAGGALLDVGIYPVMAALSAVEADLVAGSDFSDKNVMPRKVSAVARIATTGVDAFDSIGLLFDNVVANLSCGIDTECGEMLKSARFVGEKGSIIVPFFWMPQKAELCDADGMVVETFEQPFEVNGYEYEVAEFCRCMRERSSGKRLLESPLHTHAQSLRIIKVMDVIRNKVNLTYPFEEAGHNIMKETDKLKNTAVVQELDFSSDGVIVYTDGGCSGNPGPGGWGCVVLADGMQYTASGGEPITTNNRMELSAAIAALSAIIQNDDWKTRPVTVHIDSQYVKNGITSWIKSWQKNGWKNSEKQPVKNRDLWEVLDSLNKQLCVTWKWVKGHSGVQYNEICDRLASQEVEKYSR